MAGFLTPVGVEAIVKGIARFLQDMGKMNNAMSKTAQAAKKAGESFKAAHAPARVMATRMALLEQKHREAARAAEAHKASLDNFIDKANKAGTALLALAAAGVAVIGTSTMLAARVETLGIVTKTLGKNAGKTEAQIRSLEKAIQAKGITVQASRQALAMMMQAELDLANAVDLARLAQDTAVIANMNSSQAFEQLIAVIQTGNIRMGRTLGLQLQFGKAYERTAKELGKSTDALTEREIIESRVAEVMRSAIAIQGTYTAAMQTAGKQWTSLPRHIEEARRSFGEVFLPVMADTIKAITDLIKSFNELPEVLKASKVGAIAGAIAFVGVAGAILKMIGPIQAAIAWLTALTVAQAAATLGISLLIGAIAALVIQAAAQKAKIAVAEKGLDELTRTSLQAGDSYEEFAKKQEAWRKENELSWKSTVTNTQVLHAWGATSAKVYEQAKGDIEKVTAAHFLMARQRFEIAEANRLWFHTEEIMREVMREGISTQVEVVEAIETQEEAIAKYITTAHGVVTTNRNMWDSMKPDVTGIITKWLELINFYQSGGMEIQNLAQNIIGALRAGLDPSVAEDLLKQLEPASIAIAAEIGGSTGWEFQKALRSAMTPTEAREIYKKYWSDLPGFAAEIGTNVADQFQDALATQAEEEELRRLLGVEEFALPVEFLMTIPEELSGALEQAGVSEELIKEITASQAVIDGLDFSAIQDNLQRAVEGPLNDITTTLSEIPASIHTDWTIDVSYTGAPPPTGSGFQHGGRFIVQGAPGIDRVPVQFMATAGEMVTVTPQANIDNRQVNIGNVNNNNEIDAYAFDQAIRTWLG